MTSSDADLPSYWCPPDEPNDNASQIESGIEQFALVQRNSTCFVDAQGLEMFGALCECDGKPTGPAATALYEMYRNR